MSNILSSFNAIRPFVETMDYHINLEELAEFKADAEPSEKMYREAAESFMKRAIMDGNAFDTLNRLDPELNKFEEQYNELGEDMDKRLEKSFDMFLTAELLKATVKAAYAWYAYTETFDLPDTLAIQLDCC